MTRIGPSGTLDVQGLSGVTIPAASLFT